MCLLLVGHFHHHFYIHLSSYRHQAAFTLQILWSDLYIYIYIYIYILWRLKGCIATARLGFCCRLAICLIMRHVCLLGMSQLLKLLTEAPGSFISISFIQKCLAILFLFLSFVLELPLSPDPRFLEALVELGFFLAAALSALSISSIFKIVAMNSASLSSWQSADSRLSYMSYHFHCNDSKIANLTTSDLIFSCRSTKL